MLSVVLPIYILYLLPTIQLTLTLYISYKIEVINVKIVKTFNLLVRGLYLYAPYQGRPLIMRLLMCKAGSL